MGIKWSRDRSYRWRHAVRQYCTVGYPSDSLVSCSYTTSYRLSVVTFAVGHTVLHNYITSQTDERATDDRRSQHCSIARLLVRSAKDGPRIGNGISRTVTYLLSRAPARFHNDVCKWRTSDCLHVVIRGCIIFSYTGVMWTSWFIWRSHLKTWEIFCRDCCYVTEERNEFERRRAGDGTLEFFHY